MCCNIFRRSNEVFEVAEQQCSSHTSCVWWGLSTAGAEGQEDDVCSQFPVLRALLHSQTPWSAHLGSLGSVRWKWHIRCRSDPSTLSWRCASVLLRRAKLLLVLLAKAGSSRSGWINQCHTCRWHRNKFLQSSRGSCTAAPGEDKQGQQRLRVTEHIREWEVWNCNVCTFSGSTFSHHCLRSQVGTGKQMRTWVWRQRFLK